MKTEFDALEYAIELLYSSIRCEACGRKITAHDEDEFNGVCQPCFFKTHCSFCKHELTKDELEINDGICFDCKIDQERVDNEPYEWLMWSNGWQR